MKRKPLARRTPMKQGGPVTQMSDKREQRLRDAGTLVPGSTFAAVPPAMRVPRKAKQVRPAATGPDQHTVDQVLARDHWSCVRCGGGLHGARGVDWSIQHRRARGRGGSSRPDTNAPQNLLSVCGGALTGCHGHIESHRDEARAHGWAVRQSEDPLVKPVVHFLWGHVFLTAEGKTASRRPTTSSPEHGSEH